MTNFGKAQLCVARQRCRKASQPRFVDGPIRRVVTPRRKRQAQNVGQRLPDKTVSLRPCAIKLEDGDSSLSPVAREHSPIKARSPKKRSVLKVPRQAPSHIQSEEGQSVFTVSRPVPPPIQSPCGGQAINQRFEDAILQSRADARGARRVLFTSEIEGNNADKVGNWLSGAREMTWQISIGGNVFTIQMVASLAGRRYVTLNGRKVHSEFRPLHRMSIGPVPLPGACPHYVHLKQPSLQHPFVMKLLVDGKEFESLSVGVTPPAAKVIISL